MSELDLFAAAIAMTDRGKRAAFLDRECDGQPELRKRLDALLSAHERVQPILDETRTHEDPPTQDHIPTQSFTGAIIAGRYKLLEEIGEGGMGTVWMAEQREPVKRLVAIKLIKAGMDSKPVLARFEAERQALALMDHPNIAKVLDGGTTEDGRPFFVMELVKGLPLTEYCDSRKLSINDRLNLFVLICSAVQHAHQKAVIHRDLKPSNILVTEHDGKPVPKVIDFGLAKALNAGNLLTDRTLHTAYGAVVGTPLYMAPEQVGINALDVDTRTDIYALGAILYELLTGTTPLEKKRFKEAAWEEVKRLIQSEEPPVPSKRLSTSEAKPTLSANRDTEPLKLTKLLRGDLDWIVMKSLEKDRVRRYESANGLAMDVQRYLGGEAVLAVPPSNTYRFRKFVGRNKGQVIAASLVFIALLAGVIGTALGLVEARRQEGVARAEAQQREEARIGEAQQRAIAEQKERDARAAKEQETAQRDKAERARDRMRQVLDTMTSGITGESLTTQTEITAEQKKFLAEVLKHYREFAGETADDEQTRERTAAAATRVGIIEARLARKAEGIAALEMGLDGYQRLASESPTNPMYRQQLAGINVNLGLLRAAIGKRVEAEAHYRKALTIQEKLAAEFHTNPNIRATLGHCHDALGGLLLTGKDKQSESELHVREALLIREALVAQFPTVPHLRQSLGASHHNVGSLLISQSKRTEGEAQYRKAVAIQEKLAAEFPANPVYSQQLAMSHNCLAALLSELHKSAEAQDQFQRALAIRERLAAKFPAVPQYGQELAASHFHLAVLLSRLGKSPEAEDQYRKALAILEKLVAEVPTVPLYRHELGYCCSGLGQLLTGLRKYTQAEEQFRKGLTISEKLVAEFPSDQEHRHQLSILRNNLGLLLSSIGNHAEAEDQFRNAIPILEKLAAEFPLNPAYQVRLGGCCCNLGNALRNKGLVDKSLTWFSRGIQILTSVLEHVPHDATALQFLRNSYLSRALAHHRLLKYPEAIADWDKTIALSTDVEGQSRSRAARAMSRAKAGQAAEAVADAAELTKQPNWNAVQWYDFACIYSLACGKIPEQKEALAVRAMELLHRATKMGYKEVDHMRKDTDLDPIRDRDDFKRFIADLEAKDPPKTPEKK